MDYPLPYEMIVYYFLNQLELYLGFSVVDVAAAAAVVVKTHLFAVVEHILLVAAAVEFETTCNKILKKLPSIRFCY